MINALEVKFSPFDFNSSRKHDRVRTVKQENLRKLTHLKSKNNQAVSQRSLIENDHKLIDN